MQTHPNEAPSIRSAATAANEIAQNEKLLRGAFDEICESMNIYQGDGPPFAYFETVLSHKDLCDAKSPRRYFYTAFAMGGEKPHGQPMETAFDFAEALRKSVATFRESLKPNRTLVWRTRPEVDISDDGSERWACYWRWVQLDDDAKQIDIVWHF